MRKSIVLSCKINDILPRAVLVTNFKTFVQSYLDYGDVLYNQAFNSAFYDKLESIQYNACLVITGVVRGTREKIFIKN